MFVSIKGEETKFESWSSDVDYQVKEVKRFENEIRLKMGYILAKHTKKGSHIFLPLNFNLLKIKTDFYKPDFNVGVNRKILNVVQSLLYLGRLIGGSCLVSNSAIGGEIDKGKELILDLNFKEIEGLRPHKLFCDIIKGSNMTSLVYEEVAITQTNTLKHFVWTRLNRKKLSYGVIGLIKKEDIFYFGSTCRPGYGFDTEKIEKIYCYPALQ